MILAHIIAYDKQQALDIINLLMDEKLLLQAAVSEKTIYQKKSDDGALLCENRTLIIGKTKGLLFNAINEMLKKHFAENMPMLYSIPIIYMDETLATLLRENTTKV